jgi:hypothetical protein
MALLSRSLRRQSLVRTAAAVLGVAWLGVFAAFVYSALKPTPSTASVVAAAAAFLIAGVGILYAWREPGR